MVSKENIPEHWDWKKLDHIGEIYSGGTPDRENESYFGGEIPWLRLKDAEGFYVDSAKENITEKGLNNSSAQLLPEGTVIVSTRATIGRVTIAATEVATNQGFKAVYPEECVPEYVAHYMNSIEEKLNQKGRTTTYPEVNKTQFKNTKIPVPPLEEQKAIVEKLEDIFEKIEEIQNAQEQAEEIYRDIAFSFFTSRVRDAETDTVETDELIESTQYGSSNATNSEGDGYPSLRMGNYNLRGEMDYSKIKYQDLEDDEFEKYRVEKGDVLFNRTNSKDLVGKMCIYDGGLENAVFASYLIRVELNEDRVLPEYFVTYMNSHLGEVERQGKLKQAVSQANINATELREMEMAIPSLERQKEIVKRLNYMRSKVDDIKSEVDKKGKLIEDMPNSILAEAFKGNLVDFGAMSESDELGSTEQGIGEKQESSFDGEGQQSLGEYH